MIRLTAVLACLWASDAVAQTNCAARDVVIERIGGKYAESQIGVGVESDTALYEIWRSEDKGTWTVVRTHADGTSCIMAHGTNWRDVVAPKGVPG